MEELELLTQNPDLNPNEHFKMNRNVNCDPGLVKKSVPDFTIAIFSVCGTYKGEAEKF